MHKFFYLVIGVFSPLMIYIYSFKEYFYSSTQVPWCGTTLHPKSGQQGQMKSNFFGYWLYLADGTDQYYSLDVCPEWVTNSRIVSLAFINPTDFNGVTGSTIDNVVPLNFQDAVNHFQSQGKVVFFSIGGEAYAGNWASWWANTQSAYSYGVLCAALAKQYGVGIEIDFEGGSYVGVFKSFVQGFRSQCPMGECLLSFDINGGGTTGPTEMYCDMIANTIPPTGAVGDLYKNGTDTAFADFTNMMVVDACRSTGPDGVSSTQAGLCGQAGFWFEWMNVMCNPGEGGNTKCTGSRQWIDCMEGATFNTKRAVGSVVGSSACSQQAAQSQQLIDAAALYVNMYELAGIFSWAVCNTPCGDWDETCFDTNAGWPYLCKVFNC